MIVVLDSSVWISALEFGGTPDRALTRALTIDQLAISSFIRNEVLQVMVRRFGRAPGDMEALLDELLAEAAWVEVSGQVRGVCRDASDDAILETAWRARAACLVSGDRDLLSLGAFQQAKIISPADYLRL